MLGISSGAKLTVAILMVLALSRYRSVGSAAMIAAAFAGAMLSMGFVLLMARAVRRSSMLIVSGVMIGYICSAVTDFIVAFAGRRQHREPPQLVPRAAFPALRGRTCG